MDNNQIVQNLAQLLYYQSSHNKKGEKSPKFEDATEAQKRVFISLSEGVLDNLEKLDLKIVPKCDIKDDARLKQVYRDKLGEVISGFFDSIKCWKKDLIPGDELAARIMELTWD